jgi:hypothetical protein
LCPAESPEWSDQHREEPYFRSKYGFTAVGRLEEEVFPADGASLWDEQTKTSSDTWLWLALNADIERIDRKIEELRKAQKPPADVKAKGKRKASNGFEDFIARLSKKTREELRRSDWKSKRIAPSQSIDDLYWLVEELAYALKHEIPPVGDDKKYERVRRDEARSALEKLDDVMTLLKRSRHAGIGRPRGD